MMKLRVQSKKLRKENNRAYASNTPSFRILRYRRSTLFQRIIENISGLERRHEVSNESMQNQIK